MVLELLGWDLNIATPYCILEQILRRISPDPSLFNIVTIRAHSETLVALVATEYGIQSATPNCLIAVSCLIAAFSGKKTK